jgi:4-oxalocrotonate tautomerase
MPTVQIEMIEGRTVDQKRTLVKSVTEAICSSLSVPPSAVTIIIRDMQKHNLGKAGKLRCDEVAEPQLARK